MRSAIILCGGLGTRLSKVLPDTPKCLAPIGDHPFLYYLFHQLSGFDEVILSVGHLSHKVIEYAEQIQHKFSFQLHFAIEKEPLGTGGAISFASKYVSTENFIVINGDTFFDISLSDFLDAHIDNHHQLTLALQYMDHADRYGIIQLDGERIKKFEEKKKDASGWINAGIYAINKNILSTLPEKYSWEQDFMNRKVDEILIQASCYESYFIDIGVPEDYERGQKEIPLLFTNKA